MVRVTAEAQRFIDSPNRTRYDMARIQEPGVPDMKMFHVEQIPPGWDGCFTWNIGQG